MRAALAGLVLLAAAPLPAVEIVGHRGAAHDAPENTVPSFQEGYRQKADADELDIYLTADGGVIVIHDANTRRTAGLDRKVAEQTVAELQALEAGAWKGEPWRGTKLPTLSEALATVPPGKGMFIEVKCGAEVLPALEKVLPEARRTPEQLTIIGFGYEVMKEAKERFPLHRVYWLVSPKKETEGKEPPVEELIAKARAAKLDGLDVDARFAIDEEFVRKVHAAGLKLYTWTVDDPAVAARLAKAGVDGITTNRPGWLREQLAVQQILPTKEAKGN